MYINLKTKLNLQTWFVPFTFYYKSNSQCARTAYPYPQHRLVLLHRLCLCLVRPSFVLSFNSMRLMSVEVPVPLALRQCPGFGGSSASIASCCCWSAIKFSCHLASLLLYAVLLLVFFPLSLCLPVSSLPPCSLLLCLLSVCRLSSADRCCYPFGLNVLSA